MTAGHKAPRDLLLQLYREGVACMSGRRLVRMALENDPEAPPTHLLAVGKASLSMAAGALDSLSRPPSQALVIHPDDQPASAMPSWVECIAAQHPLPGAGSFLAGTAAERFIDELPTDARLLVLISGGGSSLMAAPRDGVSEEQLFSVHEWLLASGLDIVEVNRVRQAISRIKGGGLARRLGERDARVLCIADIPPGMDAALASGPFLPPLEGALPLLPDWVSILTAPVNPSGVPRIPHHLLADAAIFRETVADLAGQQSLPVAASPRWLEGDAADVGRELAEAILASEPGIFIWTGETTVELPATPGRGGRCQQLALAAADRIAGEDGCYLLACGSDGLDGPEGDAGAVVDGGTVARGMEAGLSMEDALDYADAGRFLAASGDLVDTGPTGTNVNDLIIGLRTQ
ncbi:DUF4147 domain-containing protein [Gammaproteobacteria bacterium AB-CW1]|uniref:DUF4147 domain-containing protein n=1 Tax=Natronospira elongata TaxID=3110268 RepID=A0AAP6JCU1_9GAMM|nr:DUF4147 domain-containing protein [Gammaproteobacteria bacterium AB-CW1]